MIEVTDTPVAPPGGVVGSTSIGGSESGLVMIRVSHPMKSTKSTTFIGLWYVPDTSQYSVMVLPMPLPGNLGLSELVRVCTTS